MDQKIVKKLSDQKFINKLIGLHTKAEAKKAFEDDGLEISDEQLTEVGDEINEAVDKISALPPEELDKISGGILEWLFGGGDATLVSVITPFNNATIPMSNTTPVSYSSGPIVLVDSGGQSSMGSPYAWLAASAAVVGGGYLASKLLGQSKKAPEPVISDKALITGAVVIAVVGGTYALSRLKDSWFKSKA